MTVAEKDGQIAFQQHVEANTKNTGQYFAGAAVMAKLIYTAITSLDVCIEDSQRNFDWSMPEDEVHSCINNLARGGQGGFPRSLEQPSTKKGPDRADIWPQCQPPTEGRMPRKSLDWWRQCGGSGVESRPG